jgi:hypothetical protein
MPWNLLINANNVRGHGDVHVAPITHQFDITMALLKMGHGHFRALPQTLSQLKFLIVAISYCTKWIKVKPLARIAAANVIKFFKKIILARYEIPQTGILDNGIQLIDKSINNDPLRFSPLSILMD